MRILELVRPNIKNLKPYISARDENQKGILLDANENPYNILEGKFKCLQLNRYPDPGQNDLRVKLGSYLGLSKVNLFYGVGSDEIIDLLIRIFCEPGVDEAVILIPTYGMYKVACDINNVKVREIPLNDYFQIDMEKTVKEFRGDSKLLFLCSPNNPTGNLLNKEDIIELIKAFKGIVVVDEAYADFADSASLIKEVLNFENLVVLRTFSKAWGLAGIRCGFCTASGEIIELLFKVKAPYNVNKLTSQIVLDVLENIEKKESFISIINSERERMYDIMNNLKGIEKVFKSNANFILFKCNAAEKVLECLSGKGIVIRDRSRQPFLENCLRVSVGSRNENDIFLEELQEALCRISI